jgi:predicted metal-binding membrane protein
MQTSRCAAMTSTSRITTATLATLGLAGAAWVIALQRMRGMDMGTSTDLGSLSFFIAAWVPMMAAMMLPGAVPVVAKLVRADRRALSAPLFAGSYLAVWTVVGLAVYALYDPHGAATAGVLTIAAGAYELTPVKRDCRRRCRESFRSGFRFGVYCVGSSIGLMVMLVALGVMSVAWMATGAGLILAQKLLPPRAAVDVPVALAIAAFGTVILVAPASVPGLVHAM